VARDAVILLNLGGPDSPAAVEPFLFHLFSDPDIFTVPLGGPVQELLARLIARMRARRVAEHYRKIGGASPLLAHTQAQARRLEERLAPVLDSAVYIGMRYWHPFIAEALDEALRQGARRLILLPLYPQYSVTTTGSSLHEVERWVAEKRPRELDIITIRSYPDHPLYVQAVVERIEEALGRFGSEGMTRWALVFSAHGLPVRYIANGDPYLDETRRSVAAVVAHLRHRPAVAPVLARAETVLSFQSKVGPLKWLEPSTAETVRRLGHEGITHLLVVPISFVSDNIETLYELNIELREIARRSGITTFIVAEALNDSETFAGALAALVLEAAGHGC
jgi:ferrochelatase